MALDQTTEARRQRVRTTAADGTVRGREDSTLFVVSYDIPNDRRRGQIHKMLSGFGEWRQFSLFECFLTAKQYLQLQERLRALINTEEDQVRIYRLCVSCMNKVESVGHDRPHDHTSYIV
jgi:CRISPR-associated protein Cas2